MTVEEVEDLNGGRGQVHIADNHNSTTETDSVSAEKIRVEGFS